MKGHGGTAGLDWPTGIQYFRVAVMGNGAAAPIAPPSNAYPFADGSTADYKKSCNSLSLAASEVPTRSGTGLYVITYDVSFRVANILACLPEVYGASGVWAQVASWNPATRQVSVRVFAANGSAVDLLSTDLMVLDICARDTTAS